MLSMSAACILDWWRSKREVKRETRSVTLFCLLRRGWLADEHKLAFSKHEKVKELEDASCVDEKDGDKPVALVVPGRFPECQTFPEE